METFILTSIIFTSLIILGGLHYRNNYENKDWEINNDKNNNGNLYDNNQPYYEKFISKNQRNDFLDFSGGNLGI